MLIPWLLKYDGYPPGVVVALLVHGILLYIFLPKQFDPAEQVRIEPASFAVASAAQQSPQRMRRLQQQTQRQQAEAERERQRQRDEQRKRDEAAAAERQRVAEENQKREAERKRAEDEERARAEAERQRVAQAEQDRRREEERQRQLREQAAVDAARQAQQQANNAQAQSVEQQMVAQYVAIIKDLVSSAWSRPPSARNGMLAIVQLRLTPTGEIISSTIVQSSGDAPFDRSVKQAVDRVGNFSELQDVPTPIFERYFRNFNLEFRPEDLLR